MDVVYDLVEGVGECGLVVVLLVIGEGDVRDDDYFHCGWVVVVFVG